MTSSSTYPASLDTFNVAIDGAKTLADATQKHSEVHDWVGDALNKIEAELGVNPSGAAADVAVALTALGVPTQVTAYTPGHTGWEAAGLVMNCAYAVSGHLMTMWLSAVGTSDILPTHLGLPDPYVVAAALPAGYFTGGIDFLCRVVDNGGASAVGLASVTPSSNHIVFSKDIAGTAFTTSGGKAIEAVLTVPI